MSHDSSNGFSDNGSNGFHGNHESDTFDILDSPTQENTQELLRRLPGLSREAREEYELLFGEEPNSDSSIPFPRSLLSNSCVFSCVGESEIANRLEMEIGLRIEGQAGEKAWRKKVFEIARCLRRSKVVSLAEQAARDGFLAWWKKVEASGCKKSEVTQELGKCWSHIRNVEGIPLEEVAAAPDMPWPSAAGMYDDDPQALRLLQVVMKLDRYHEGKVFFLSCRKAAQLAGIEHFKTANDLLWSFQDVGLLFRVKKGSMEYVRDKQEAMTGSEWAYIGDDKEKLARIQEE